MNGQDLYDSLRYVDPALLEEAMEPVKRSKWRQYLPVAACVVILLAGTAVAAEVILGVQITHIFRTQQESGYQVLPDLEPYPAENFSSPALTEALEEIQREHPPKSDEILGEYCFSGDTWADCQEFLGVSLPNPLEGAESLEPLSSTALPLSKDDSHCSVTLTADADGNLQYVSVATCYEMGEYKALLDVDFSMEGNVNNPGLQAFYDGITDFEVDTYRLSDGQEAALLIASQENMRYTQMIAYFVRADGIYSLSVWRWGTGYEEEVREQLCRLLDLF